MGLYEQEISLIEKKEQSLASKSLEAMLKKCTFNNECFDYFPYNGLRSYEFNPCEEDFMFYAHIEDEHYNIKNEDL